MDWYIWVIIILSGITVVEFFSNKSKNKEIELLKRNYNKNNEELSNKIKELQEGLQKAEGKLQISEDSKNALKDNLSALKKAYLISRKNETSDINMEIEKSIYDDYRSSDLIDIKKTDYIASEMADFYTIIIKRKADLRAAMGQQMLSLKIEDVRKECKKIIEKFICLHYSYENAFNKILNKYPQASDILNENNIICKNSVPEKTTKSNNPNDSDRYKKMYDSLFSVLDDDGKELAKLREETKILKSTINRYEDQIQTERNMIDNYDKFIKSRMVLFKKTAAEYKKEFSSNLTAIPYMSKIIADIMTIDIDRLVLSLSWGENKERLKKVASLSAVKKEKAEEIERIKSAEYQLAYLLDLYPALNDVIDTDYSDLNISYSEIIDDDPARKYISDIDWSNLSESQRNQLALDRYIESCRKSKWQIGRDYELYCGFLYEKQGCSVDYYGSFYGLEDLGRDLIVKKQGKTSIIQCKYWSKEKEIHEKHIMQLFGTVVEYNITNGCDASGVLVTNTVLSYKAKEFAEKLGIKFVENKALGDFPRIKCNIGIDESGKKSMIYHLPFDQQYDKTKIEKPGEFMAFTVEEAEQRGFRRAWKWHGGDKVDAD